MQSTEMVPLLVLVGPTGVGKTELSIRLAEKIGGEIISADSRLFYRGMDIGTAKPSQEDRSRVPHHLIDIANPDEIISLAEYQSMVKSIIAEIVQRNHLPILVGGTGQYIRAITESWQIPKLEPNPTLRDVLTKWANEIGKDGLHRRLASVDSLAAEKIDPRNVRRTIRALEVILVTGRRFSDQRSKGKGSLYDILQVGLCRPRNELYERIDLRVDTMLQYGWIDEVRHLLSLGYSPELPTLSAIGYREIIAYLHGKLSLAEMTVLIKRSTHLFVRRQANWFKMDDPQIDWYRMDSQTLQNITDEVRAKYKHRLVIE